jgi:hypothetical protein
MWNHGRGGRRKKRSHGGREHTPAAAADTANVVHTTSIAGVNVGSGDGVGGIGVGNSQGQAMRGHAHV